MYFFFCCITIARNTHTTIETDDNQPLIWLSNGTIHCINTNSNWMFNHFRFQIYKSKTIFDVVQLNKHHVFFLIKFKCFLTFFHHFTFENILTYLLWLIHLIFNIWYILSILFCWFMNHKECSSFITKSNGSLIMIIKDNFSL